VGETVCEQNQVRSLPHGTFGPAKQLLVRDTKPTAGKGSRCYGSRVWHTGRLRALYVTRWSRRARSMCAESLLIPGSF
jgi:hypothetical protein